MRVRFKGLLSDEKDIPGGGGQGCLLGMWLFLFLINYAGPPHQQQPLGEIITKPIKRRTHDENEKEVDR